MNQEALEPIPNTEQANRLKEIVRMVLENWPVLQLSLDHNTHSFGNKQRSDIIGLFTHKLSALIINYEALVEDVEDFLDNYLEQYFQVHIQDDSQSFIANQLLELYSDLEKGSVQKYNQIKAQIEVLKQQNIKHQVVDSSDEDDEEDDQMNVPQQQNQRQQPQQQQPEQIEEEDEDGFQTVVAPKRKFRN